ncbi:cytochrome P450 4C1-like [Aricia agestis]|uniref:cytochrome P450 4C1-like n=1 Tax=Aricia agestis TaxID=91739 RepID=UPI001C204542|nr:cytochrome P450 4C1-like [Aricia agestis]
MWRQSVWLTETLAPYVGKGPFRIEHILGGFCFDNIIGAADIEELRDEYSSVQMCFNYVSCLRLVVQRWTSLWMQTDLLHRLSSNHREMDKLLASLHTYVYRAQEMRRNKLANFTSQQTKNNVAGDNEKLKPGLFDNLINSKLSKKEISEEIAIMFAASDECGLAIFFTLKLLAMYPSVQDKAFEELQNVFGDSDRSFVKEDLTRTPYLDMVIKESLRIFSIVPFVLRKAHTDTKLPSGRVIPAGAGIGIAIYSVLRDPKYWGPDADHFDPERFLPERLATVPDIAYKPFSYGPRSCPGYKFAQNIIKIGLCSILRKYKVVGTPAAGPVPCIATKYEIAQRPVDDHIELVSRS